MSDNTIVSTLLLEKYDKRNRSFLLRKRKAIANELSKITDFTLTENNNSMDISIDSNSFLIIETDNICFIDLKSTGDSDTVSLTIDGFMQVSTVKSDARSVSDFINASIYITNEDHYGSNSEYETSGTIYQFSIA